MMMEEVADAVIEALEGIRTEYLIPVSAYTSAYFEDVYGAHAKTKFGDPGIVLVNEYPFLFVDPVNDIPYIETIGLAGYDVRNHILRMGFCADVSDYWNPDVDELVGLRQVTQVMDIINRSFRRFASRTLYNLSGVRNVTVSTTEYKPYARDESTFVMCGLITLTVERQYQHEE